MHRSSLRISLAAASSLLAPALTHAQSIVYAPVSAVPTLGEWATMGLAVLIAVAGLIMARRMGSKAVFALALSVAAALTAGNSWLLGKTYAAPPTVFMSTSTGDTIDLSGFGSGYDILIIGNSTKPMRLLSVTPASEPTSSLPTCVTGMIIETAKADAAPAPSGTSSGATSICYYRKPGPI